MESGSGTTIKNVLLPYQAITRFGLARGLRPGEETTFAKLAEASVQAESNICKVVRAAIAQRIFEEPRPGVIRHSAASRLLAENPGIHDYVATVSNELWPAAAQTCNAWAKFPGSEEPNEMVSGHTTLPYLLPEEPAIRERNLKQSRRSVLITSKQGFSLAMEQYRSVYV